MKPDDLPLIIRQLPDAFVRLAPELQSVRLPEERRADCTSCHMAAPDGSPTSPRRYNPDARCCTYHPVLPNFLVGRGLASGGVAATKFRERLADRDGVTAMAIRPTTTWLRRYYRRQSGDFGTKLSLRCPYWAGGDLACGIWEHRGAVCRTWFCRFEHGPRGLQLWMTLKRIFATIEERLSRWAVEQGDPPKGSSVSVAEWEDWYRVCYEQVRTIDDQALAELNDEDLAAGLRALADAEAALSVPLPDVVVPRVSQVTDSDDGVWLSAYSSCDARHLPRTIFLLLSALDGERRWRDALSKARRRGLELDEDQVEDLYLAGILGDDPSPDELEAGGSRRSITFWNLSTADLSFEPEVTEELG